MYHSANQLVKQKFFGIFLDLLGVKNSKPRHLRWHWPGRWRKQA